MFPDIMESKESHVHGTCLLAFSGQPMGINKSGVLHPEGLGLFVHLMDEDFLGT